MLTIDPWAPPTPELDVAGRIASEGYVRLPGLLTDDQLLELRAQAARAVEQVGDPLGWGRAVVNVAKRAPELTWAFALPTVLGPVRDALGSDDIFLIEEANLHRNFVNRHWHKDLGDTVLDGGFFGFDPIGRDDCRIVKVAIYLQDHLDGTGLRVKPGTQTERSLQTGERVILHTRAGDGVLFDLRLTHRGTAGGPVDWAIIAAGRLLPRRHRADAVDRARRQVRAARHRGDRLVLFCAYGIRNAATQSFSDRVREDAQILR